MSNKKLNITDAKQLDSDVEIFGDGNTMKLICKASSKKQKWMKSTKAMEIEGVGCYVQSSTQQGDNIAEAVCFVPDARIKEVFDDNGNVIARRLVYMFEPEIEPIEK